MMKIRNHLINITIAGLLLICLPSLALSRIEERKEVTYNLNKDGKVYLENVSGDISISSWNKNRIRINAVKKARAGFNLNDASIDIHQYDDSNIRILTRRDERSDRFGESNVSVYYELIIPDKAQVRIKTVSGDVVAVNVGGAVNITTVSGDIEVLTVDNGIKCKTISGDIDLGDITGNAEIETISGEIFIDNINGSVAANTVSGDIRLEALSDADEIILETTSGEVYADSELRLGGLYEIDTISGDIEMIMPSGSNFELNAKSTSGHVETDFLLTVTGKINRKKLQGVVGKGGSHLNISTFSGDIEIKKR
jgi:DUF4097 and DUF4098 domain-containing protein YvlB